ncbi:MAG: hypothetical protein WD431_26795 [Cyclobacteriaceae bacterium]
MKNKTKLIVANLFALLAVVLILVGAKLSGVDVSEGSSALFPKILLFFVPQFGFVYFYWKTSRLEGRKAVV